MLPIHEKMKIHAMSYPYNHVVLRHVFNKETYLHLRDLVQKYKNKGQRIGQVGHEERHFYQARNYSPTATELQEMKCSILISKSLRNFIIGFFDTIVNDYIAVGIHTHKSGSPSGWAHSDLNIVSFKKDLAAFDETSLKLWERGSCSYADDSAYNQPHTIKTARHIACIYYVDNQPWQLGDGGETAIYSEYENDIPIFSKIPPLNNTMLIFEINPVSSHGFLQTKKERNSIIWWYHTSPAYVCKRNQRLSQFKKQYMNGSFFDVWTGPEVLKWSIKSDPEYALYFDNVDGDGFS